jgi:hypothetical protein
MGLSRLNKIQQPSPRGSPVWIDARVVYRAVPAPSGNNQEFREERTRRSAEEAAAALGLIPTAFDRQVRDGVLALESVTVVGGRELYQREQIRRLILAT